MDNKLQQTKKEVILEAINIIDCLCDGFLDMPSGCEGCPLMNEDDYCVGNKCVAENAIYKLKNIVESED